MTACDIMGCCDPDTGYHGATGFLCVTLWGPEDIVDCCIFSCFSFAVFAAHSWCCFGCPPPFLCPDLPHSSSRSAGAVPDHGSSDDDPILTAGRVLRLCISCDCLLCLHYFGGAFCAQGDYWAASLTILANTDYCPEIRSNVMSINKVPGC